MRYTQCGWFQHVALMRDEIGYESHKGSLRGARALLSESGRVINPEQRGGNLVSVR